MRTPKKAPSRTADLLFEIGTEELPAAYLPSLIEQLGREAGRLFQAHHLPSQQIQSFGTPRRLVLFVRGLASTQHKPAEEVRGPSKKVAYDEAGKPTKALLGFLRAQGITLTQTKVVSSHKGEYIYAVKQPTATPVTKVLPALLSQLIGSLRAPKTMRWDASRVRFARPIRWLLALYGASPIRCTFGTLTSAPKTWIGLPLRPRRVPVTSLERYRRALKTAGIILEQETHRAAIAQAVTRIAKQAGGTTAPEMISHGLLDEVTYLVEQPVPLAGAFDKKYLTLPREVLLASMAKYQRVFAIESKGKILPKLVAMLEGTPKRPAEVKKVIERILNARLADSLIFWADDLKQPLTASDLSGVTFHERLGSMEEKAKRLEQLSAPLADAWGLGSEERAQLQQACRLAKTDLVTSMVKEFPTLQGVIGKYYALHAGEPRAVADAIEEQYLPLGGRSPKTVLGRALAILDKYDTLASYFGIGIEPTGDQDPFGLRRAAQGIVEVGWKMHRPLPLGALMCARAATPPFHGKATAQVSAIGARIQRYLYERLYTFAWPAPVPAVDCIDAALASPCDNLIDVMDRIVSLQQLNGHPGLRKAAKVVERTRNILKGATLRQPQVDPSRLVEAPEQKLWDLYRSNESRVAKLVEERAYAEATTMYGELFFEPLHQFFDQVLVNVPEESLQQNRLALMQAIQTLYTDRIADLSKLTLLHHEEAS